MKVVKQYAWLHGWIHSPITLILPVDKHRHQSPLAICWTLWTVKRWFMLLLRRCEIEHRLTAMMDVYTVNHNFQLQNNNQIHFAETSVCPGLHYSDSRNFEDLSPIGHLFFCTKMCSIHCWLRVNNVICFGKNESLHSWCILICSLKC